ncbi:MAG: hypothetical protein C5B45_01850 [Chlamydiae bacterium]|nr:MAG: hypothetical protein C5B45_01850 [Chlamydiota bacterium]
MRIVFILIKSHEELKRKPAQFIGRETGLEGLLSKNNASLIVVRGRRRIGKSRLLAKRSKKLFLFWKSSWWARQRLNLSAMSLRVSSRERVFLVLNQMIGVISFGMLSKHTEKRAHFNCIR